jgi:hypothetical protein
LQSDIAEAKNRPRGESKIILEKQVKEVQEDTNKIGVLAFRVGELETALLKVKRFIGFVVR